MIEFPFGVVDHAAQEKAIGVLRFQIVCLLGGFQRVIVASRLVMRTRFSEIVCYGAAFVGHDGLHLELVL